MDSKLRNSILASAFIIACIVMLASEAVATVCKVSCTRNGTTTASCWDYLSTPSQCQSIADSLNHGSNACHADWSLFGSCPAGTIMVPAEELIIRDLQEKMSIGQQ